MDPVNVGEIFPMLKNVIQPKFTDFQVLRFNRVTKGKFNIFPALN